MKRTLLGCALVAAMSAFTLDARAHFETWSMPYIGNCNHSIDGCISVQNGGTGPGLYGSGDNYGVQGWSDIIGVYGNGIVGVKGVGVYGVEAAGITAPIYLSGTIPNSGTVHLCKNGSGTDPGAVGICGSTRALKQGIHNLELGVETLMQLRPVTFQWRSDNSNDIGFIAEEVASVNPILAVYNGEGKLEGVKYTQLTALLTKTLQDQTRERNAVEEDLRKQLTALDRRNAELTTQLRDQQALVNNLASRLNALEQRADLK
jgi:hypothetical protein